MYTLPTLDRFQEAAVMLQREYKHLRPSTGERYHVLKLRTQINVCTSLHKHSYSGLNNMSKIQTKERYVFYTSDCERLFKPHVCVTVLQSTSRMHGTCAHKTTSNKKRRAPY